MTRGQLKRILIAVLIGLLAMIIIMNISSRVNYEVTGSQMDLFDKTISEKNKETANLIVKELKEHLKGYNEYSSEIDFSLVYQDGIEAQVIKKDYLQKLQNEINKPYIEILKKYFKARVINVYQDPAYEIKDGIEEYRLVIDADYVDIEKNYKIFKNRQHSNEIDANLEFLAYLQKPENIVVSKKYINNYIVKRDTINKKNIYSAMTELLLLQIPLKSATETIEDILSKIVYDVSLEPIEQNKELFKKAKISADKELQQINDKDYEELSKGIEERYSESVVEKTIKYTTDFYKYYSESDLIKFIEKESNIKFIGYNNVNRTLLYEIDEYPYEEAVELFAAIDYTSESDVIKKANKFQLFKKLVDNNEIQKTKRIIEIRVDSGGMLEETLISKLMPSAELLWNKEELEFAGLVSIKPQDLPGDYSTYFTVQAFENLGKNIAVVYVPSADFPDGKDYEEYIDTKVLKTLEIVLGYNNDNTSNFYKNKFDELYKQVRKTYIDNLDSYKTVEFDSKNSLLNGVLINIRKSESAFTMIVKCNNWEVQAEE